MTAVARGLIAEKGVEGLRISDVTERADVAFGSFYTYFESKAEVIEAVVSDTFSTWADALIAAPPSLYSPVERLAFGVRGVIRIAYEDPETARLLVNLERAEERLEKMVGNQARTVLEECISAGEATVYDMPAFLLFAVTGSFAVMRGILEGRIGPDADIACAAVILQSVGVQSTKAYEIARQPLPTIESGNQRAPD